MGSKSDVTSNGDSEKARVSSCPLDISTSHKTLFSDKKPRRWSDSSLPSVSNSINPPKLDSPSTKFKKMTEERDQISRSVTTSSNPNLRERISLAFSQKIDWNSLMKMGLQWLKNPINIALFLWILVVAVSGAILFMVMTGMLNSVLTKKSQRDIWFEVNNQILNALFTLMCLYQHPKRFYHFILLCRWKQDDITKLRTVYCKNGTYKPKEWLHMMIVILLLHLNCFAQYALCGLNLGYKRSVRPAIGVAICISTAIAAPAIAGFYTILSPLGKDYDDPQGDEENQVKSSEKRYGFASKDIKNVALTNPQWRGGVLDIWEDISLAYLSLFCSFCVFGWNMERIGFGNMYVHIATFILLCSAPFFIFNLAAVNIDDEMVREGLGVTGLMLCVVGLMYGGFWRMKMRKRFRLPSYEFCCGKSVIGDFVLWMFCCWCSLAQEVRTVNSYEVIEERFCEKEEERKKVSLTGSSSTVKGKSDEVLNPPLPPLIDREAC